MDEFIEAILNQQITIDENVQEVILSFLNNKDTLLRNKFIQVMTYMWSIFRYNQESYDILSVYISTNIDDLKNDIVLFTSSIEMLVNNVG